MRSIRLIRKTYIKSLLGHFFSVYYVFFVHILFMLIMYNKKWPIKVKLLRNNFPSNRLLVTIWKSFFTYIQHLWWEKTKNASSFFIAINFIVLIKEASPSQNHHYSIKQCPKRLSFGQTESYSLSIHIPNDRKVEERDYDYLLISPHSSFENLSHYFSL